MTFSSINLSGTISKDAEQRYTPNNNSVITFMMQVLRYHSRDKTEKAYPVKVNLWGDNFTNLLDRLKPNTRVLVSGRLELEQFTDRNGKNIRLVVIEANNLVFPEDLQKPILNEQNHNSKAVLEPAASSARVLASEEEIPF